MRQQRFITFLLATVAVLLIGTVLPSTVALGLSVIYFVAVAWLKPNWVVPLLILYFPVRPVLIEFNPGLKLAGDLSILVLVAKVTWDAIRNKQFASIFQLEWYEWAYLAFCAFGAAVAFTSDVSISAIIFQLRKFLMMYLLFYGLKRLSWNQDEIMHYLTVLTGVAVVLSFHGWIEKLTKRQFLLPEAWSERFISPTNADRIYGLINNPNSFGMFLAVAIIATFILLYFNRHKMYYPVLIILAGTLLLTFSRGTFIGFIFAGILYFAISKRTDLLKRLAIVGVAGYILIFLPVYYGTIAIHSGDGSSGDPQGGLGGRFGESFDEETLELSSKSGRLFYIKKGFEVFADHPITGTGFATFGDSATLVYSSPIYDDYGLTEIHSGKEFYSDNQYLQVIAQTGTIGVVLFATFLLNILYRIWTARKISPEAANILLAMWMLICTVSIFYNAWENKVMAMLFFTSLAWLEAIKRQKLESSQSPY